MDSHAHHIDLRFDGPIPEDSGWPLQLKIALTAVVLSMSAWVGAVVGSWLFNYYQPSAVVEDYGLVSFVTPAPIADGLGVAPFVEGLPIPSIDVRTEGVPVSLTRVIDCAYFECAEGAMPVLVDIRFVEVGEGGQELYSYVYLDEYKTTYNENEDYILDTTQIVTNTLSPFTFPEEILDRLEDQGKAISTWRIEGTTTVDRPDAIPASWRSEVFYASLGMEG